MQSRLAKLALRIGRASAQVELSWLKRATPRNVLDALDRRIAGEPIQYILGTAPFGPLDLLARPPCLIPRPETEHWTLRLAETAPARPVRVLDLCTGSGCIPLLLCHLWPPHTTRAFGVDTAPHAVRLAADNNARLPSRNTFMPVLADIRDPAFLRRVDPPFDLVTANPPYIPRHVYPSLDPSVREYEDPGALIGDFPDDPRSDGLAFYRTIAALLALDGVLASNATIALEVGHDQAHAVRHILLATPHLPITRTDIWKDPWDKDRVVVAHVA